MPNYIPDDDIVGGDVEMMGANKIAQVGSQLLNVGKQIEINPESGAISVRSQPGPVSPMGPVMNIVKNPYVIGGACLLIAWLILKK
jgi:hypothetical protein